MEMESVDTTRLGSARDAHQVFFLFLKKDVSCWIAGSPFFRFDEPKSWIGSDGPKGQQ